MHRYKSQKVRTGKIATQRWFHVYVIHGLKLMMLQTPHFVTIYWKFDEDKPLFIHKAQAIDNFIKGRRHHQAIQCANLDI